MKHIQSTTQKHEAGLVVGSFQHMNPVVMQCNLGRHNSTSVLEFHDGCPNGLYIPFRNFRFFGRYSVSKRRQPTTE